MAPIPMPEPLQLALNEVVRGTLQRCVGLVGRFMRADMHARIGRYRRDQDNLRERLEIGPATAIHTYDDVIARSVERYASHNPSARFAYTSGSTAQPKKIAFTPERLAMIKRQNFSVVARTMLALGVKRPGLFILSGLKDDDSLSTLILSDRGREPPYVEAVLMAARYLSQPSVAPLLERYGPTATRLWLLTLSNPGIVYSTNPSTLALFLTDVYERWAESSQLLRDFATAPENFDAAVRRIALRVASPGWRDRLAHLAARTDPVPMAELAPGLEVYCCWDGGYVRPFLARVEQYLPAPRFRLVPMYSMSTETIETLNYYDSTTSRFLAIAPDVLYEFLPEGAEDDPARLLAPWELASGSAYTLVVSDPYGLTRYQTEDVFHCEALVGDVPDLRFLRRRGLTYSFTGEKLTDVQLQEAFAALREAVPALPRAGVQLTLVPHRADDALVPSYRLVLAHPGELPGSIAEAIDEIGSRFDAILAAINHEFAGKQATDRLGPTVAVAMPYDELAAHLDPKTRNASDRSGRVWDTQFKLLPLYRQLWQEYRFDE